MDLIVKNHEAILNQKSYEISIGKGGFTHSKREGDAATPFGKYPLRQVLYRQDRMINSPQTTLPLRGIESNWGWCDDPLSPHYNSLIKLPFEASHELLFREDNLYDLLIVIGYNDDPVSPGKGSAIFIHIAKENYAPTRGCIGFSKSNLMEILQVLTPSSMIHILDKED